MTDTSPMVRVHVNIELPASTLQAVVANTKKAAAGQAGRYPMDTADTLAALISRFLRETKFEEFAGDASNY